MSTQYIRFPNMGIGVIKVATFADLPLSAANGQLFEALDTNVIYAYNTTSNTFIIVGGPGQSLSIGTIDSETPSADGALINNASEIIMQSASDTVPGLVNNTVQMFSGDKTIDGDIAADNLSGTNTGDITLGTANGLDLAAGQILSLDLASTTDTGALSSADWNTFNSKQPAGSYVTSLTGDVTATGPGAAAASLVATSNATLTTLSALSLPGSQVSGNIAGNAANVTGTVAVANGGTGQTSYTDGQLLIGNSTGNTLTKASLTAGAGISITPGSGSITIAATGGGTVTNVTASSPLASSGGATPDISLTGIIPLANGGSNKALTAVAGGVVYMDADSMEVTAAGTAGQVLTSNGSGAPTWAAASSTSYNGSYYKSSQSVTSGTITTVVWQNTSYETDVGMNTGTGVWTAPATAKYRVSTCFQWNSFSMTSGSAIILYLYKNGSLYTVLDSRNSFAATAVEWFQTGTCSLSLTSGDTIEIRVQQNGTGAQTITGGAVQSNLSIESI